MAFYDSLASVLGGIFGDSGGPYRSAGSAYNDWYNRSSGYQNPFYNAGVDSLGKFQDWIGSMKDPSSFINNIMSKYQESPMARYMKDSAMRAGINSASASGLSGSTPFSREMEQTAGNISSQDMNNYLSNVLGINSMYGSGLGNITNIGKNSADILSQLSGRFGENIADARFGQSAGNNQDIMNILGGLFGMLF